MTAFHPINSHQAADFIEKAGIPEARRIMVDFAAAGLLKAYALVIETSDPSGVVNVVRNATIPIYLWKRIVSEGVSDDVWSGGTVHLQGSDLIGGRPTVRITGIGFSAKFLQQVVEYHGAGARPSSTMPPRPTASTGDHIPSRGAANMVSKRPRRADPQAIPEGAMLATINQTMAALGLGRTKVNELMNSGRLERVEIDGGVRITTASVRAMASGSL